MVDLVVLYQQNLMPFAANSALEFFEDQLLANNDLLSTVLVAICTGLAFFLRIKYNGKLRRFEGSVDELKSSIEM